MARGATAKQELISRLKTVFPDLMEVSSKEIRIPWNEGGERVELKIALSCAKENLGEGVPKNGGGHFFSDGNEVENEITPAEPAENETFEPNVTEQEKEEISDLLARLNL